MFQDLDELPPDALLGLTRLFNADPRAKKIDLGVGVFRTPDNRTPVLESVRKAEARVLAAQTSKVYTPAEGAPGFADAISKLLLGENHPALESGRVGAVQTPGGCGALRIGAEVLRRAKARAVYVGAPTWPNHQPLLSAAGHAVKLIPYYDAAKSAVDFPAFLAAVDKLGPGDVLLLHGACHNPTGADLSPAEIDAVCEAAQKRGFTPFIDMAYHGFANGLEPDAYVARAFAERLPEVLISYSCSKNFGLYRERTGALLLIGLNAKKATALKSHALNIARGIYSMPPAHGGSIVAEILSSPELSAAWRAETDHMRQSIKASRKMLVAAAAERQLGDRLAFIEGQQGMFSMLPLSEAQVMAMRERFGVYMAASGRVNVCGVNAANVDDLADGLRDVMKG